MKCMKVSCSALVTSFSLIASLPAAVLLDFDSSVWDHSAYGGSASSHGWASADGVNGGVTTLNDGSQSVTVTVEQQLFGTAEAYHSILHNDEYGLTDTAAIDNYLVTAGSNWVFGGEGALNIGARNDLAPTGGTFQNYTAVSIRFSKPVTLTAGTLTLGDNDSSNSASWNDNAGLEVFNGNLVVGYSFTDMSNGAFFDVIPNATVGDRTFDAIVSGNGSPKRNATGNDSDAEVEVSIAASFDSITLYYWNTNPLDNEHGIYLKNNAEFSIVPEPGTFSLLAGLFALASIALKRRGLSHRRF